MIIDFNRYNGGGSSSAVTPEQVQEQINSALTPYWESGETKDYVDEAVSGIDLSNYYTSAQTEEAISAATSGKADAANVTPNDFMRFPKWNAQGIITGTTGNNLTTTGFYLNGTRRTLIKEATSGDLGDAYAPTTPGNAGEILVSTGNGAPVWSAVTGPDMSGYWTSAETKTYVDSAVTDTQNQLNEISGMMQSKELVISTAFNQLNDEITELSGRTVDLSGYYTSAQTEDAISAATSGKADAVNVSPNSNAQVFPAWNEQGIVTGTSYANAYNAVAFRINGEMNIALRAGAYKDFPSIYAPISAGTAGDILVSTGNGAPVWSAMTFITSADVETQILSKNYITSADTADFLDDEDGLVISTALNDLDDRVNDVETSLATKVSSSSVSTIWKGTQAQYDAITTKDPATFYIIVSSN